MSTKCFQKYTLEIQHAYVLGNERNSWCLFISMINQFEIKDFRILIGPSLICY